MWGAAMLKSTSNQPAYTFLARSTLPHSTQGFDKEKKKRTAFKNWEKNNKNVYCFLYACFSLDSLVAMVWEIFSKVWEPEVFQFESFTAAVDPDLSNYE